MLYAKIASVDMNGLQGRQPHPGPEDKGRIGKVLSREQDAGNAFYRVELSPTEVFVFADYELDMIGSLDFELATRNAEELRELILDYVPQAMDEEVEGLTAALRCILSADATPAATIVSALRNAR